MRIVRKSVQKEAGEAMAGQMIRHQGHLGGKDQPCGIDRAGARLATEVLLGKSKSGRKPQYAPLNPVQKPHPDVKNLRSDFLRVVEAAEDKSLVGQARISPRRNPVGYGLVAVRQVTV